MLLNLTATVPSGVLPGGTYTAFSESRIYPVLSNSYHDGTQELGLIQDGVNPPSAIKTWKLSVRRTPTDIATLIDFYESHNGPLESFYFYNPMEPESGHAIGSNYDGTGDSTQGRYTVKFVNQSWSYNVDMGRANVSFELLEVA